jgi:hypothetical protein
MTKKENGRELLRQDNAALRKQFVDCRDLLEKEREENAIMREKLAEAANIIWDEMTMQIKRYGYSDHTLYLEGTVHGIRDLVRGRKA